MFTGIIEAVGKVVDRQAHQSAFRLWVETTLAPTLRPGDSLAVNGVCLTVTTCEDGAVCFDVGPETARITNLGAVRHKQTVNLERPLRLEDRVGGHLVLGHVDGLGAVDEIRAEADSHWLTIAYPAALAPYFIRKGSVAVDGVSLTIARLGDSRFEVQIIPYTWQHTTLGALKLGDTVNVECDMIGKYVVRSLELSAMTRPTS